MRPIKRLKTRVSLITTKKAHAALGRVTMYDDISVSSMPNGATAYAGYVNGIYDTWSALVNAKVKTGAWLLSIDVFGNATVAHCLDVENGDATNADIVPWFRRMQANGVKVPVIYTSAGNSGNVISIMEGAGYTRTEFLVWSAHYTYSAHICAPGVCDYAAADGTQWSDEGPGGCDVSALASYFFPWTFGTNPKPDPTPPAPPKPPAPPAPPKPQPYPAPNAIEADASVQGIVWEPVVVNSETIMDYTVQVWQLNGVLVSETVVKTNSVVLTGLTLGYQYNVLVWANGSPSAPPHAELKITA